MDSSSLKGWIRVGAYSEDRAPFGVVVISHVCSDTSNEFDLITDEENGTFSTRCGCGHLFNLTEPFNDDVISAVMIDSVDDTHVVGHELQSSFEGRTDVKVVIFSTPEREHELLEVYENCSMYRLKHGLKAHPVQTGRWKDFQLPQ